MISETEGVGSENLRLGKAWANHGLHSSTFTRPILLYLNGRPCTTPWVRVYYSIVTSLS